MKPFSDRLHEALLHKKSRLCVGIDPRLDLMPKDLTRGIAGDVERAGRAVLDFSGAVIDAVRDHAVAVKPQIAYYERLGPWGLPAYFAACKYAHDQGLIVIGDVKRGDIAETATAYAEAHLSSFPCDAITVNPFFGTDGMEPFVRTAAKHGGGLFVLVKTSNPSSSEIQDLPVTSPGGGPSRPLYRVLAEKVVKWGESLMGSCGYSSVGAVVGATHPDLAAELRAALPRSFLLIPGYGAQGATAADVARFFAADGSGAIVNASRSVLYPSSTGGGDWRAAIGAAAATAKNEINTAIEKR